MKEPESNIKDDWHSALALEQNETIIDTWEGEEKKIEPLIEAMFKSHRKVKDYLFLQIKNSYG